MLVNEDIEYFQKSTKFSTYSIAQGWSCRVLKAMSFFVQRKKKKPTPMCLDVLTRKRCTFSLNEPPRVYITGILLRTKWMQNKLQVHQRGHIKALTYGIDVQIVPPDSSLIILNPVIQVLLRGR